MHLAALALLTQVLAGPGAPPADVGGPAGPPPGSSAVAVEDVALAVRCAKAFPCAADPDAPGVIDDAVLLVDGDGRVAALGPAAELDVPAGCEVLDLGEAWILPGMIDLHSHVGGTPDWTQQVFLANPGARVSTSVVPANRLLRRALAGGITSVLYIPGSATNMSGQGVLLKTSHERYEDARIRDPGSLKVAQAGNPESFGRGTGRMMMNWNTRDTIRRGLAYAGAWQRFELGEGPEPEKDPQWEVFRALLAGETQVSTHTQMYQVVLTTLTMLRMELGLEVYLDHGTFDGWRAGALAQSLGVAAILGPRQVSWSARAYLGPDWYLVEMTTDGRVDGIAARYQEQGHTSIGFNTDAIDPSIYPDVVRDQLEPTVVTTEELPLQAALGVRFGMRNENLETLRGLTIVPARAAGIDDRVGSLEPGKDADFVVVRGDPADPRVAVEAVYVEGELAWEPPAGARKW
jgi:imidazolonepropionase-like amidohydrolase